MLIFLNKTFDEKTCFGSRYGSKKRFAALRFCKQMELKMEFLATGRIAALEKKCRSMDKRVQKI
jgi:hypothetical protein